MIQNNILYICLFCSIQTWAQSSDTKYEFQKTMQSGAARVTACPADIAEHAIVDFMAKKGIKSSSYKEFTVFRGIKMDLSDTLWSDLYFVTTRKSRQQKDLSVITLIPVARNQSLIASPGYDTIRILQAKIYLDSMAPFIDHYYLTEQLDEQDQVVRKNQKRMNSLLSDESDLNKRIRKLQSELAENKQNQSAAAQQLQSNILVDDEAKTKAQKKLNKLMNEQGTLEKHLRNAQLDLDQNKKDQATESQELQKQIQALDALKALEQK